MAHKDYSHRDVVDRLGIKLGHAVAFAVEAKEVDAALCQRILVQTGRPPATIDEAVDVVLVVVDDTTDASEVLKRWKLHLKPQGGIWLLTAKRGQPGYVDQMELIAAGLQAGLVDNKVCSISSTTSAMRFVIRKKDRPSLENEETRRSIRQDRLTMYFIGVTTGQSSMMRLFPLWAEVLGLSDAQLVGIDLPLHAAPEQYRQVVAQIKVDPLVRGALITTHKVDVFNAAYDMLDTLDMYAQLCSEISCISKRDGKLIAHAKDPLTSRPALQEMLEKGYWQRTGAHVLCLGAGGSGTALAVNLLTLPDLRDRPRRMVMVSRSQPPLDKLRAIVAQLPPGVEMEYVLNEDPQANDQLLAELPPGSLVINATGMGKDRPGSPITDAGVFPRDGVVWELNYRGVLDFLHQAKVQQQRSNLSIHDGWRYFLFSWADHIAQVFNITITPEQFARMAEKAGMIH